MLEGEEGLALGEQQGVAPGMEGDHGLVQGAWEEGVSGVRVQGKQRVMVYLELSAALRCWACLGAYRREGRRHLLIELAGT